MMAPNAVCSLGILAEGLAKRSPSSMLCNTTSSLIVRGAESAVHYGEAAQRGLTPPCTALSGAGHVVRVYGTKASKMSEKTCKREGREEEKKSERERREA